MLSKKKKKKRKKLSQARVLDLGDTLGQTLLLKPNPEGPSIQ